MKLKFQKQSTLSEGVMEEGDLRCKLKSIGLEKNKPTTRRHKFSAGFMHHIHVGQPTGPGKEKP